METTTAMVYRHVNPLYANRRDGRPQARPEDIAMYDLCLHLRAITRGHTHKEVTARAKTLAARLEGLRVT